MIDYQTCSKIESTNEFFRLNQDMARIGGAYKGNLVWVAGDDNSYVTVTMNEDLSVIWLYETDSYNATSTYETVDEYINPLSSVEPHPEAVKAISKIWNDAVSERVMNEQEN